MATATAVRNSKVLRKFQEDLIRYQKETGKASNEVLATRALDFSIKYAELLKKEAPTPEEIDRAAEIRGYNVRVRRKVAKAAGALDSKGNDYRGRFKRRYRGKLFNNKRAYAVARELAVRRSSVRWLAKSIPKWKRSLNKDIPEGTVKLGQAFTRRRRSVVGSSQGNFSSTLDQVRILGDADALEEVDGDKGKLHLKALEISRRSFVDFLDKKVGKVAAREIKKVYR